MIHPGIITFAGSFLNYDEILDVDYRKYKNLSEDEMNLLTSKLSEGNYTCLTEDTVSCIARTGEDIKFGPKACARVKQDKGRIIAYLKLCHLIRDNTGLDIGVLIDSEPNLLDDYNMKCIGSYNNGVPIYDTDFSKYKVG